MLSSPPLGGGGPDSLGRWVMGRGIGRVRGGAQCPSTQVHRYGTASAWGLALPLAQSSGVEFGLIIPGQKSMWCGGLGGPKLRFKSWLQYQLAALWLSVFMTVQAANNNLCLSPVHRQGRTTLKEIKLCRAFVA